MIMYLEHTGEGKRGGEKCHLHLYAFLEQNFTDIVPEKLRPLPSELTHPIKHAIFNLALVKRHRPDLIVVDISSSFRSILAVRWMKAYKKRVLVVVRGQRLTFRHDSILVRWLVHRCENYLLKCADIILTHSHFYADLARRRGKGNPQIIIAPSGLEVELIPNRDASTGGQAKDGPTRLLFVGECSRVKGLKPLIKALSMLKNLNIHLDVAGEYSPEDSYFKEIQEIIEHNDLKSMLTFHGFLQSGNLKRLYKQCCIFVCPSLSEGYSISLAEAIGYGLPIVATSAGAIPEMVRDNVNALLVRPGDTGALATAIAKLVENDNVRTAMSRANIKKAASLPTWDDFHQILQMELAPAIKNLIEH